MAIIGNVNINTTNKIYGDFSLATGKANYYGQYTVPAVSYNVDNCLFVNNTGTPDQIDFGNGVNALPLLTNPTSSYTFVIRGGNGSGINNIISTITIPYASYNNAGQQPLRINVGDNYFSNSWVEISRNDPGNNRVHIGTKLFDVKMSTVGSRVAFVNGDLVTYDSATNSLVFNAGSVPAGSRLVVRNISTGVEIDPTTGNDSPGYIGEDTDIIGFPYSYRINSGTAFLRDLTITVSNKSTPADTVTYGGTDYSPLSVMTNTANHVDFKGVRIINDLGQPARVLIRDGYCTDGAWITVSTVSNGAVVKAQKVPGVDLVIPLGVDQNNFLTASDVQVLISTNNDGSGDPIAKTFDLNSVFGPVYSGATFTFNQSYGTGDHLHINTIPAGQSSFLTTTDPSSGDKVDVLFSDATINFHDENEVYGLGYNLAPDVLNTDNGISANLYDQFLRPVISNSWVFDNTVPVITTDVTLITGYGTDVYIGTVDNPLVATFNCAATDNNAVGSVSVQFSYDQSTWDTLPMTTTGGGNYTLSLGALDYPWVPGDLYYRIQVRDIYGNTVYSPVNQVTDVSISETSSFAVEKAQEDGFLLGKENLRIRSIIGDPGAESISLTVYDSTHHKVKDLAIPSLDEGFMDFYWDGTNNNGTVVPFGSYDIEIKVNGILDKADLNTTITVQAIKEKKEPCMAVATGLNERDLNYLRKIRSLCINGLLDPDKENDMRFKMLETGIVFYYRGLSPFYRKYIKSKATDMLTRQLLETVSEQSREIQLERLIPTFLRGKEEAKPRTAGR